MTAGSWLRGLLDVGRGFVRGLRGSALEGKPQRRHRGAGELVMSAIAGGSAPYGFYSGWADDRLELVAHYRAFVYMAVRKIAETVAGLPPFVGTVKKGKGPQTAAQHRLAHLRYVKSNQAIKPHEDVEHADSNHPLVRLFETPNAHDMAGDLWYELILFLELTGNAYLWCPPSRLGEMDGTGKPAELWVVPSHWIRPVMGNGRMPDYYLILPIVSGPGSLRIPPEEMIHFRYKSPIHKIDGFSALRAGDAIIDTYEAVNQARYWQMRNGCFPAGALSMEAAYQDPDEQEMERIGAKFAARYQGTWNTGRPVVLPPGMKYDPLVINPTEMAYLESADQMMTWVLALFGVPKEVLGLQPSGGDLSWYAPRKQFHSETIKPKLQYLGQTITRHLASRWGDDLRVWWPDSVPDSPEDIRELVNLGLTQGFMTFDEARAMTDLPEMGGMAAELLVPSGKMPIDSVGQEPDMGGLGEGGVGGTESFFGENAPKDEETGRVALPEGGDPSQGASKKPSAGSFFGGPKNPTTGRQELNGEGGSEASAATKAHNRLKAAESFFGECDRDEGGHCKPSGRGDDEGSERPAGKPQPQEDAQPAKKPSSQSAGAREHGEMVDVDAKSLTIDSVIKAAKKRYPKAGEKVDGREVLPNVDNKGSIKSSLDNYQILPGIREVPLEDFQSIRDRRADGEGEVERRGSADDERRVEELAAKIKESGKISPLIVVDDGHPDGPYVLEGGHRVDALERLGAQSLPALVVLDIDAIALKARNGKLPKRLIDSGKAAKAPRKRPEKAFRKCAGAELLDLPDIRQEDNFSCGAAVAMAVGRYFGVGPETLEEWKEVLGTTEEDSTQPPVIVEYLQSLGLDVEARQGMTLDDLRAEWAQGRPVICCIQEYGVPSKQASYQYGHYVAVIGVALGMVMVQDPSIDNALERPGGSQGDRDDPDVLQAPGRSMIPESVWQEAWHDEDAFGEKYVRFGISVGARQESALARLAARSRRQFALAFNGEAKAAESYFGNCPRDEEGHCKPSGRGHNDAGEESGVGNSGDDDFGRMAANIGNLFRGGEGSANDVGEFPEENWDAFGPGLYLTPDKSRASGYGDTVTEYAHEIKNPKLYPGGRKEYDAEMEAFAKDRGIDELSKARVAFNTYLREQGYDAIMGRTKYGGVEVIIISPGIIRHVAEKQ